jgi:hypothetical protein
LATVRFSSASTDSYVWNLGNPGAFSHWEIIDGADGDDLIVNLDNGYPVAVNLTYAVL